MSRLRCSRVIRPLTVVFVALASLAAVLPAESQTPMAGGPDREQLSVALDHLHNLEYEEAREELEAWLRQHPTDLHALNYLGTVILHHEMFHRGILETQVYGELGEMFRSGKVPFSPGFQQELLTVLDKAQMLAENRMKRNPDDQEAMYWAGAAHATRAVFHFTMLKAYVAALRESNEARKYHVQLLKVNPAFVDALLVVGLNDYVAGALPWYFKIMASLAGYRGNRAQGLAEVKRVTEQGHWAREDARFILAVLCRREKMYPQTLAVLQGLAESYPRNFLVRREIAGIYGIQGDWRAAAKVYDDMVAKYEAHQPGYTLIPVAKILYEAGQIHDRLGESAEALKRYEEAERLPANDIYVYRAELAAADLYWRQNRRSDALRKYRHVAAAVPNTEEGKAASRALKKFQAGGGTKAGGAG